MKKYVMLGIGKIVWPPGKLNEQIIVSWSRW
jgi:hypothetical protein